MASPARFRPEVFEVANLEQAKEIITTSVAGATAEQRWRTETPFLARDIPSHLQLTAESVVLDYGCGIGRVSRALIETSECRVIGVDFSASMRLMAPDYVLSERFVVWSPQTLDQMIAKGFRVDAAISIWVIQHAFSAPEVIGRIHQSLKSGGMFYCLNMLNRCVPTDKGWIDDGFDWRGEIRRLFTEVDMHALPREFTTGQVSDESLIQILRKPTA